jgi:hypothetical protein
MSVGFTENALSLRDMIGSDAFRLTDEPFEPALSNLESSFPAKLSLACKPKKFGGIRDDVRVA